MFACIFLFFLSLFLFYFLLIMWTLIALYINCLFGSKFVYLFSNRFHICLCAFFNPEMLFTKLPYVISVLSFLNYTPEVITDWCLVSLLNSIKSRTLPICSIYSASHYLWILPSLSSDFLSLFIGRIITRPGYNDITWALKV